MLSGFRRLGRRRFDGGGPAASHDGSFGHVGTGAGSGEGVRKGKGLPHNRFAVGGVTNFSRLLT